jgi:cell division FtsZ-interacting protein ZapD
MAITRDAHADLSTRILALVAEYAAASDRAGAEAKATAILERVPVVEDGAAAVSEEDARAMVAEIDRRGQQLEKLRDSKQVIVDQLKEALKELDATKAALAEAHAALDTATKPTDQ